MFKKEQLDPLLDELKAQWHGTPDFENIIRDVHIGVAYFDGGKSLDGLDSRATALIEKHAPTA